MTEFLFIYIGGVIATCILSCTMVIDVTTEHKMEPLWPLFLALISVCWLPVVIAMPIYDKLERIRRRKLRNPESKLLGDLYKKCPNCDHPSHYHFTHDNQIGRPCYWVTVTENQKICGCKLAVDQNCD